MRRCIPRARAANKTVMKFDHALAGCYTTDEEVPEKAIAVPEDDILELYAKHGLEIEAPIRYGSWSGKEGSVAFQDTVVAHKGPVATGPARAMSLVTVRRDSGRSPRR